MLLGYQTIASDIEEFVVVEVLGPGPGARHRRRRFEPDGPWQQERLEERYRSSGRVTTYLGDWHTHPRGRAAPSWRDVRCARRIARCRTSRARHPLMLIVGGGDRDGWQPGCSGSGARDCGRWSFVFCARTDGERYVAPVLAHETGLRRRGLGENTVLTLDGELPLQSRGVDAASGSHGRPGARRVRA
jgi:integrative and conjugative element protein (TIGR02256 family)